MAGVDITGVVFVPDIPKDVPGIGNDLRVIEEVVVVEAGRFPLQYIDSIVIGLADAEVVVLDDILAAAIVDNSEGVALNGVVGDGDARR